MDTDEMRRAAISLVVIALPAIAIPVMAQWKTPVPRGVVVSPAAEPAPMTVRQEPAPRAAVPSVPVRVVDEAQVRREALRARPFAWRGFASTKAGAPGLGGGPCGGASWFGAVAGAAKGAAMGLIMTSLIPLPSWRRNQLFFGLMLYGALSEGLRPVASCSGGTGSPYSLGPARLAAVPDRIVIEGTGFELDGTTSPDR